MVIHSTTTTNPKDPDNQLLFIREKIEQLQHALMYVSGDGLVKLGNDIVTAINVDDHGHLWFLTHRPSQRLEYCDTEFPATLQFYRKGVYFFMEVNGKACIVASDKPRKDNKVLVKFSILTVEYSESAIKRSKGKLETVLEGWYNRFLQKVATQHDGRSVLRKLSQTH